MNLALFDFDGTITTGDTFTPFLRIAIPKSRAVLGGLLISPVLVGNRLGLISTPKTRPIVVRAGFRGVPAAAVREIGRRYASEVLPTVVEPTAMECLQRHQRQGDTVAFVSAGLDAYLRPWCDANGVVLICSELEERHDRLTGRYRRGDCSGPMKAVLIRARFDLNQFNSVFAYGDTREDREMLALANRKYFRWKEIDDVEQAG